MFRCITYFRVGYLLHLFSLLEVAILYIMFKWFDIEDWLHEGNFMIRIILLVPFSFIPSFPQLDAWSRFQNYKLLRDKMYQYGFNLRLVKPFTKSRCQRDAVFAAASDLGLDKICTEYFYERGYRWYHILPHIFISNPSGLLKKQFWLTTFFEKKYTSRIDDALIRKYKNKTPDSFKWSREKKVTMNLS